VITGFNTDIEHNGTVYHVQTEDKGLETPLILSLVYVGGASFDQAVLGERLQRQHKLICAAINAGRIEDLKRMGQTEPRQPPQPPSPVVTTPANEPARNEEASATVAVGEPSSIFTHDISSPEEFIPLHLITETHVAAQKDAPVAPVKDAGEEARMESTQTGGTLVNAAADVARAMDERIEEQATEPVPVEIDDALHVELLGEKDYHAGEMVTLRIAVLRGAFGFREIVRNANVTVKVLGTEFRPLILTSKTDADGLAVVHVWLPRFKLGRAAILVRANSDDCSAELRRIIHHN
jgi:hypothetical protein